MEITKAKNRSDGLLSRRVFQGVVPIPSLRISVGRCNHLDTFGRYGLKIRLPESLPDAPRGWTLLALHDLDAASHKDLPHRGGASSLSSRQPRITDHGSRQFSGGCFPGAVFRGRLRALIAERLNTVAKIKSNSPRAGESRKSRDATQNIAARPGAFAISNSSALPADLSPVCSNLPWFAPAQWHGSAECKRGLA